ncbi:RCC1 domain-containing protein [Deinococcus petrolearius]|uniref:RCC1 domain-containing protein n=1 Tax=Deinococcus petrolearius TaxID=1751295 RepID=A0ABW1DLT4_9DEIO
MRRQLLPLLLPALLLAACGQTPATGLSAPAPGTTTPGTPTQQALPGVFQIDFGGVGTDTPTTRVQSLQPSDLSAQGLVSAPDQFSFSPVTVQTFTVPTTNTRHIRVTYKVTNTSSQTLRNPKFIAVVPQGSTTDSVFTNVRYFDGSDATAAISKLSLVQGQSFNTATNSALPDPLANPVLTSLDVSTVDTTGKGIKTLTQTGWGLTTPSTSGATIPMAPGDTALITFGVNLPLTPAAEGGATKDPFNFSLNVTAVQDAAPLVAMTSVVKQWDAVAKTFGNYVKFPTRTYTENGATTTRSLPAYYDLSTLDGSTTTKVLCAGDANMSVTNISTATFPNRWRVQLFSLGEHTLKVFAGTSCPTDGIPLLSQTVTGVGTGGSSLAASISHSVALKADGTVQSWGENVSGQLGNGTRTTPQSLPGAVSSLNGIVSIAVGSSHNLALRADGTVQSWGGNTQGQLGNGTKTLQTTPVAVSGLSDIVSIATGANHSLALLADGTVRSWGYNLAGQLGDGTTTDRSTPVIVTGLSNVVSIAGGGNYSLALRADGTVQSWGLNTAGQLGDGTTTSRSTPATISGLSGVMRIAAGHTHNLALRADGTVQSWGSNNAGQLGDGTIATRGTPVTVRNLSEITSVSAGGSSSLALRADGTIQSWGDNTFGQLGDGTTTTRMTPVPVSRLSGLANVATTAAFSVALRADGTLQSWGQNDYGQLGDGTKTSRLTFGPVAGVNDIAQPTP